MSDNLSFTQKLREEGFIITDESDESIKTTATKAVEETATKVEEEVKETAQQVEDDIKYTERLVEEKVTKTTQSNSNDGSIISKIKNFLGL